MEAAATQQVKRRKARKQKRTAKHIVESRKGGPMAKARPAPEARPATAAVALEKMASDRRQAASAAAPAVPAEILADRPVSDEALEYLRLWDAFSRGDATDWKFNKKRQTELLDKALLMGKLGDEDFGIFCRYVEELKGGARERLLRRALEALEAEAEAAPQDGEEGVFRVLAPKKMEMRVRADKLAAILK
jgi:hypothetical protein